MTHLKALLHIVQLDLAQRGETSLSLSTLTAATSHLVEHPQVAVIFLAERLPDVWVRYNAEKERFELLTGAFQGKQDSHRVTSSEERGAEP